MALLPIINEKKQQVGEVSLKPELLSESVNKAVLYEAVKRHLASKHHGTVDTKTRAEVNRTNKKVFRQKGTGNARHGSMKSAPFVGGGRVFGPHPRSYALGMNKKTRQLALREVLRHQLIEGNVTLVQSIPFKETKTQKAKAFFDGLGIEGGLVVIESASDVIEKSVRNLKGFKLILADQVNVFDLLKYPRLILTSQAFGVLQQKYLM